MHLSVYLFFQLSIHLSIYRSIYLSVYLSIYLVNYRSISLCVYLCIYSSVKFSLHLSFDLPLDLSINLSSRHVDNKTMVLDLCWQHQKRSNSARQTAKTKQFCETSFKNRKLTVQLTASHQCVLRFFHAVSLKYCACHEKVSPGHTKCCTCHEKASWHSWWFDTPKCNPSQEISSLSSEHLCWRCRLYCACHEKCILFKFPTPAIVFENATKPSRFRATFQWMHNPLHLPHKTTSERPKCLRDLQFLTLLTSKCASCHNAVHFFDISTSKSAPRPSVFNTFDFEMCFAPQRRALFRHLNFQKCSETLSF